MAKQNSRRILLVEDDEDDYLLTKELLTEMNGWKFEITWARGYEEALEILANDPLPDALLVDYDLGGYTGLDLVRELARREVLAPAIMLTGRGSYDVDLEAMRAGATDYLVKGEVTAPVLERVLRYAIDQFKARMDLRSANDELESRVQQRTRELEDTNRQLQQEMAERMRVAAELNEVQRRLIDGAEAERLQFAQELHDGPMQELYASIFQIEELKQKLQDPAAVEKADRIEQILQGVNQSLRITAGELRPPALAPYGLEKAFRSHAEYFGRMHPELQFILKAMPDRQRIPERGRLVLFRIYQQALANILRHAQASQVIVNFSLDDNFAILEIRDNGKGFKVPSNWIELVRTGHLGLVGARERAESVGGTFVVESKPGEGTLLRAVIPLSEPENSVGSQR